VSEVERLRECLRLVEKATEGPWHTLAFYLAREPIRVLTPTGKSAVATSVANAELIAAAVNWLRTDAQALLARLEGCERDAASWRALQQLKQEGVACNAIPKHEWELVGDLEAVPVNYGYSIRATHGWEQCKRCGLKRHFTRDPGTAHADTLTGREGGG
jgi:hypothetical protein